MNSLVRLIASSLLGEAMAIGLDGLTDEQVIGIKTKLTEWGLLDPRFNKTGDPRERLRHNSNWYSLAQSAYEKFLALFERVDEDELPDIGDYDFVMSKGEPPAYRGSGRSQAIARLYDEKGWYVARGTDQFNVLWVEDITREWRSLPGVLNNWDDVCIIWQVQHNGQVGIIEQFNQVTTEPGAHYTYSPVNINGAARIEFGQYKAWVRGLHGAGRSAHQGFRQVLPIRVCRDLDKSGTRTSDKRMDGVFYCNWHSTIGAPNKIGRWSAGCSVFRYMSEFRNFMAKLESDRRYQIEKSYAFIGAYAPAEDLVKFLG